MVARKDSAESPAHDYLMRSFEAWRLWLSRRYTAARHSLRATGSSPTSGDGTCDASRRLSDAPDVLPLTLGLAGLAVGAAARIALAPIGPPRADAAIAVAMTVALAAVRLMLLAIWLRRADIAPADATRAWALGLAAWVIAIDAWLAAIAWAASALVTYRTLIAGATPRDRALTGVAIAWGAHAAAATAVWLATSLWIALLASG